MEEEDNKQSIVDLCCSNSYFFNIFDLISLSIMTEKVIVRCNWTQSAGKELSQLVLTRFSEEDVFEK